MPKKGSEYELFVKAVYECLNHADGLSDAQIQHDVKLVGAAGVEHQIDVFWTFKLGGVNYKVAVECKDYNRHVSKEKIEAFHSILHDIGNIHGIFASKMGFQNGAILYAQKYGIQLMEIRKPIDSDWEGSIKDIHIELCVRSIGEVTSQIFVNKARAEEMGVSLPDNNQFHMLTDRVIVEFGEMIIDKKIVETDDSRTMYELIKNLPVGTPSKDNKYVYAFKKATIRLKDVALPIDSIEFIYETHESTEHIVIYGEESIMAIVKNITDGSETCIDKFGRVSIRESVQEKEGTK